MPQVTGAARELGKWQLVDRHWTCVYPPGLAPDPDIVKAIRSFCPHFVPVMKIEEYVTPTGGSVIFAYHVIGLWLPEVDPTREEPLKLERPADFPFTGGVVYAQRVWSRPVNAEGARLGLPDEYLPFDWKLHKWMQAAVHEFNAPGTQKSKVLDAIRQRRERDEKEVARVEDDFRQGLIEDRRIIKRLIDEEKWTPAPRPDPKPYVFQ